MNHILENELTTIADPRLEQLAIHAKKAVLLAATKAAAHLDNPVAYPMPADHGSVEHLFLGRLAAMKPEQKRHAAAKLKGAIDQAPEARARALGALAAVDLRSSQPILEQRVATTPPDAARFDRAHLEAMVKAPEIFLGTAPIAAKAEAAQVAPIRYDNLELRIHKIKCLDETNPELGELAHDKILLGGVTIDETGDVKVVPAFKVSNDFDDGDAVTYDPPKRFTCFNLTEGGGEFPKTYYVMLVLAEQDNGGFGDFLGKLLNKVKDYVTPLIGTAIGAGIGGAAGPIGAVLGALIGAILGALINWLVALWQDDIFPEIKVYANIKSYDQLFASGQHTSGLKCCWTMAHGGKYGIWFDWRVYP